MTKKNQNSSNSKNNNKNLLLIAGSALACLLIQGKSKENLDRLKLKLQKEQYKNLNENLILLDGTTQLYAKISESQNNKPQINKEICPDCKGSGQITLLISTVDCEKCKNI